MDQCPQFQHRCVGTSALPVVGLCQELPDFIRGYGKRDARRHLQRVDADHFAVLKQQIKMKEGVLESLADGKQPTRLMRGPPELPYCEAEEDASLFIPAFQILLRRSWTGPHVDDGVRLDVVHVRVLKAQLPAPPLSGANDPGGDGVLEGERAADGHHELPWSQVRGAAEQKDRKLRLRGGKGAKGQGKTGMSFTGDVSTLLFMIDATRGRNKARTRGRRLASLS